MIDALRIYCHTIYSSMRGGSKCERVAVYVCVWLGGGGCSMYHPDVASSPLSPACQATTVAAVVNPQTAGMWIKKFSPPRIQNQITLVPD